MSPMESFLWARAKDSGILRAQGARNEAIPPSTCCLGSQGPCVLIGVPSVAAPASHQAWPSLGRYLPGTWFVPTLLQVFACCHLIKGTFSVIFLKRHTFIALQPFYL